MKRIFWLLLLGPVVATGLRAQTATITGPASPVAVATGNVTVSGTLSGATTVAVDITDAASGATIASGNATLAGATWSFSSWAPAAVGNYTIRATPASSSATGPAATATVTINSIAPTVTLAVAGGPTSIPAGAARYLAATATDDGAIVSVEFSLDGALLGTVSSPAAGAVYSLAFTAPTVTGPHQLVARAYDNAGNATASGTTTIEVTTPVGSAPTVGLSTPLSGTFLPAGVATSVNGTVADADGAISSVVVFLNGVSLGTATVTAGNWVLDWTPSLPGAGSLSAIASDDRGNAVLAPAVAVTITDSSSPAVVLSLSPTTATVAASTTLSAGATRNLVVNATPATGRAVVRVEFFIDGTKVGEATTAPYTYRFTGPATAGHYVFSARATDNAGLARDAQTTFTVAPAVGLAPTVSVLAPTGGSTVVPNTAISLVASAVATGGSIASVQFYVNGSPVDVNSGHAITAAPYTAAFTPTAPGTYVIDAIATDDRANTTVSSAVTVTAAFGTPSVAITSPNPNVTARATPNIPLTLTATAQGGSGAAVLLVEFLLDGTPIGTRTAPTTTGGSTYSWPWTPTTAQLGAHQFTVRVTDTNSLTATSSPAVNVTVAVLVGTPPTLALTQPAAGTDAGERGNLQTRSTVNFVATAFANGSGSTLTGVEFFLNHTSIGRGAREQAANLYRLAYDFGRYDFSALTPDPNTGRYTVPLYAIATDSNNNQTITATSTLSFTPATSAPPTVQLTALGPTAVAQNTAFQLLATPSDPDGAVTTLQLYANGVLVPNAILTAAGAQTLISYPSPTAGRFNLIAVATDDSGNTAVSTPAIVLNVAALGTPTAAVTRPGDDATVTNTGAPVFLEATASSPDTTSALTVQFIPTASNGSRGPAIEATRVGTTNTYRAVFTTPTADTYAISASATFNNVTGHSANSRRVVVSNVSGLAPAATIVAPVTATTASTVALTATATDADGAVVGVEFFLNRASLGQAVREQSSNTWRLTTSLAGIAPGDTEVVAVVRDSADNLAPSPTGTIDVVAATSAPPTVTVNAQPAAVAFSQPVALTASATDVDGAIAGVQYFVNGTSVGTSTSAATGYLVNWTAAASGTFNVYAVATDDSPGTANSAASAAIPVTVRRHEPLVEESAFVLQSFRDIAGATADAVQLAGYAGQLGTGALTRAQLIAALAENNANFTRVTQALAAYYVLLGQWPTTANYTTLFAARGDLATVCGLIVAAPEFAMKYQLPAGVALTAALLDSPGGPLPARTFADLLWAQAGLGAPSDAQRVQFRSNPTAITTTNPPAGRGYHATDLNTALADFVAVTNATNAALLARARAAALYYQLDQPAIVPSAAAGSFPTPVVTPEEAASRIAALAALGGTAAAADAALKDPLYAYRFVTILTQPQSLTVAARSGALFRVGALGQPPLSYQWLLNGAPIAGATAPVLSVTGVDATKTGTYAVVVTSAAGTAVSDPATLGLSTALTKLGNISTRGRTGAGGAQLLIAGFVVTGPANRTRQMLIRVVGPGLAAHGVPAGFLADPRLEVYGPDPTSTPLLTNDNWGTQAGGAAAVAAMQQAVARTGAFDLAGADSADAAVLATLAPGNYTVQARGPEAAASGVVLIEVYDATAVSSAATPKAINVSTRGPVGSGATAMIAGFVIDGAVSRRVLLRGVGPTLAAFGLTGAGLLADPQLELFDAAGVSLRTNDDWASGDDAALIAAAGTAGGAFPLANGSKDAAILAMLAPGAYTVQLTGAGQTTGLGLVEVYDVDP
jgi:hypothetical protein